ncbi:MAG: MBL fold metallo-hydrolase [Clostridia bacterium]|nr:MBL fold metallo-hydrolase [Clostridia bacterium]
MMLKILGNNGPYPAPGGACSGYLLSSDSGNTRLLIDCGTGVLNRLLAEGALDTLDAVLLSHLHYDHMSDMLPMQYALQFNPRPKPLPVYAPEAPEAVRALLEAPCFDLWPAEDLTIGEMRVAFTPARHPVPTNAIAVECDGERFVFTGDSNQDALVELFCEGASLLLADCGLSAADHSFTAPHYSARLCGELAKSAHAKRLLLTHLNPKYAPQALLEEAREAYPNAELAELGEVYYI